MKKQNISIRARCPFCSTPLSGRIEKVKNNYKLDMGEPDYREKTVCPNCKKHIFTIHSGLKLEQSYSYIPPASP